MNKSLFLLLLLSLFACQEAEQIGPEIYECTLSFPDNSATHPQNTELTAALSLLPSISPGVQIAVTSHTGTHWTAAQGMANIPEQVALEPCHKHMIGSISKVYTSVLVLQLQDEGILSIDDPLRDWLDASLIGEIENADQVSLKQLLNHTSGIRDYLAAEQYLNALNQPYFRETQSEKLRYVYGKSAYHTPGERYTYSNTNYVLLGLVVEKARNMPLWEVVKQHITDPLGLDNTEMGTHDQPLPTGTVRPYGYSRKQYRDIMSLAVSDGATGDGGIASNMQEVNAFAEALFSGQLLSEAAFKQMTQELIIITDENEMDFPNWPDEGYGLGISLWNTPYGKAYGHTGGTSSFDTYWFYFPEKQISLSIGYSMEGDQEIWEGRRAFREEVMRVLLE